VLYPNFLVEFWNSGFTIGLCIELTVASVSCKCMPLIHNIFLLPTSLIEESASLEMLERTK